jgi:hypothetical protein
MLLGEGTYIDKKPCPKHAPHAGNIPATAGAFCILLARAKAAQTRKANRG